MADRLVRIGIRTDSRIAPVTSDIKRFPPASASARWKSVSRWLNLSRSISGSSISSKGARIRSRSCGPAFRHARTTLDLSSTTRVSTMSSSGNEPRATWRRRSRARASLGTRSIVVPESGPLPTCERTAPWASRIRSASRTAGRLTPSIAASLRSGGRRWPALKAPLTICASMRSSTSS